MTQRGETPKPAEDWVGAAALLCFLWSISPDEINATMGEDAMDELLRNMPDAIRDMGNNFIDKMGMEGHIP